MPCAFLIINHSKYYCKINRIIWWARCTSKSKGGKFNCTFCNILRGIELFCWVFLSSGTLYTKVNSKAMNQKHGLKKYCNKFHESHRENEPLEHAAMPSVHRFPLQVYHRKPHVSIFVLTCFTVRNLSCLWAWWSQDARWCVD